MTEKKHVLIKNALILTMNPRKDVFYGGSILIEDGIILKVQPGEISLPAGDIQVLDARGGIVMPGMINSHTHLGMSFFRSLADDQKDRLRRVLFPLEKAVVTDDLVYWASLHSYTEMIQGGVTTLFDMYYFEDAVARAARKAGVRSILGETVVYFPAPDSPREYGGIGYAREFIQQWKHQDLITPAIAPHAPYTVDGDHMKECYELACREEVPMTLHLSEMPFEMEHFQKDYGMSPIAYLDDLGVLDSRVVAAHCIFTDDPDRQILKKRGVGVAHNMVANIKGAKGVAAIPEMLELGIPVGLGSDGPMSGNTQDVISLMGYTTKFHKFTRLDPQAMPPESVVEMATIGGARALHIADRVGSLEIGKEADIVIMDHSSPSMFPVYDPYSVLVYGASPRDVDTVLVKGRILMEHREILHLDIPEIRGKGQEYFEKVCSLPALKDLGLKIIRPEN
ncbi:amidohydrolase [Oceanispirochaeta sp.]|jgi:5-methylthioadenosine/S-adenosylhomocysteine deaminase|uniref:amidohydrolase n=1 Tax=Oceanispirochaeta sp. TaxID=2035350 RepID=UPI00261BA73A|nr:amidohydrolase [Oceanispirochaeta sp.]MDA3957241.1 amidohydrolase [Oceanispirochaeta sp.]